MSPSGQRSVLFVYFTYTGKQKSSTPWPKCWRAELRGDQSVHLSLPIFPLPGPVRALSDEATVSRSRGHRPARLRRRPATIGIPDSVTEGTYDFVVVGAPTWCSRPSPDALEFMESPTAATLLNGKPFTGMVTCRRYWKHNLKTLRRLRDQGRRHLPRRYSLSLSGRTGPVTLLAAQLSGDGRVQKARSTTG